MEHELYILRHGQTLWNAQNRMQGELNSPLTARGEQDAAHQGKILKQLDLSGFLFFCSPQARAIQTAGIALGQIASTIHTDARLQEIGVGDWSGRLRDELPKPDTKDPFIDQYEMAPNGEGSTRLEQRCRNFLDDLSEPAVLVTHGITSRMIRQILAGQAAIETPTDHGGQGFVYHIKNGIQTLLT